MTTHLVAVWNHAYASTAMEAHLAVLLGHVRAWRDDRDDLDGDGVYVWWGKIRSGNRQQAWAREDAMRELSEELEGDETRELQLYLTDYRSLYVGDVGRISWEDEARSDPGHVPDYYQKDERHCDCWFQLQDIRRLVADDTIGVIQELQLLRNRNYHDRPVSLYGGMVDLPLFVERPDGRQFFDEASYAVLPNNQLWVEFDAESGGSGAMQRELRENLFGDTAWGIFEPVTRAFLATAEKVYRDHQNDDSFDFHAVLGPLAKAVEVEANARLRAAMSRVPERARQAKVDERTVDLARHGALSLGQLARVLGGERDLVQHLGKVITNGPWFTGQMPAVLDALAEARNPGSHSARVSRSVAREWRERIVGIGCQGVLVELAGSTLRASLRA
ncbi:MAG: hypothetical protein IPJ57_20195 [Gemmatimonadetes bacterium]|nr:hypothetical protein [Gemmatimonadota bacterium]